MDRITSSLIRQFSDDYELHLSNDTVLFEYFCNFCAATNENGLDDIELEEFTTGISAQGIDGIAIIVNNRLKLLKLNSFWYNQKHLINSIILKC